MSYNTKNYTEQGGKKTHIGGELIIEPGGKLYLGTTQLKPAEAVANAAGEAPTAAEYNSLIAALKASGLMAAT